MDFKLFINQAFDAHGCSATEGAVELTHLIVSGVVDHVASLLVNNRRKTTLREHVSTLVRSRESFAIGKDDQSCLDLQPFADTLRSAGVTKLEPSDAAASPVLVAFGVLAERLARRVADWTCKLRPDDRGVRNKRDVLKMIRTRGLRMMDCRVVPTYYRKAPRNARARVKAALQKRKKKRARKKAPAVQPAPQPAPEAAPQPMDSSMDESSDSESEPSGSGSDSEDEELSEGEREIAQQNEEDFEPARPGSQSSESDGSDSGSESDSDDDDNDAAEEKISGGWHIV